MIHVSSIIFKYIIQIVNMGHVTSLHPDENNEGNSKDITRVEQNAPSESGRGVITS